eukprot:gene41906-55640_t
MVLPTYCLITAATGAPCTARDPALRAHTRIVDSWPTSENELCSVWADVY